MDSRLIIDAPTRGSWNMAVDEMLLSTCGRIPATILRLYQWSEPTLSLGYFQRADQRAEHTASLGCPLVRRSTGGGAILHDRELTYSLVTRLGDRRPAAARSLMSLVHASLVELFYELGIAVHLCKVVDNSDAKEPFLCFQRHAVGDILIGEHKIVGSAQRRQRETVLQHGSILLRRSMAAPELPGIEDIARVDFPVERLIERWPDRLAKALHRTWSHSELSAAERAAAQDIEQVKFSADCWNWKR